MCTSPLHIHNSKYRKDRSPESVDFSPLDESLDKKSFLVPCGQCYECRQVKLRQNQIRCYYEALECKDEGYSTFFNTLTYNPQNLPMFCGLKTFSLKDIQDFIKRLRSRLSLAGFPMSAEKEYHGKLYKVSNFKYFIAPEYGSLHGQPHYHTLFFCHFNISPETFCMLVHECWNKGFTQFTNPYEDKYYKQWHKSVLNVADGAIQYVAKYCNKDIEFIDAINHQDTKEFLTNLNRLLERKYTTCVVDPSGEVHARSFFTPLTSVKYSDLRRVSPEIDNIVPRCRYSEKFGIYALNVCSDQQLISGAIPMPDKFKTDKIVSSVIPYYDNKLFYDYDKTGKIRRLNDDGLKMRDLRYKQNIDYVENNIFETLMFFSLNHHEYKERITNTINKISAKYHGPYYSSLEDFIHENNLLDYNTRFSLAAYRTIIQGLDLFLVQTLKFLLANETSISYISDKLHVGQLDWYKRYGSNEYTLNSEFCLSVIDELKQLIGGIKAQEYLIKVKKDRENKCIYDYYSKYHDTDVAYCEYLNYIYGYEDIFI